MSNESKSTNDILPGTLFDWRKPGKTRVASYRVDGGQLLWVTDAPPTREVVLAVLLDGKPVEVTSVRELDQKPRRLRVECRPIASSEAETTAEVELSALFESLLEGSERIAATRVD